MKCPCIGCLIIPLCKNKGYIEMVESCEALADFLVTPFQVGKERDKPLTELVEIIKPTLWSVHYRRDPLNMNKTQLMVKDPTSRFGP
jgi:hypothetical protein